MDCWLVGEGFFGMLYGGSILIYLVDGNQRRIKNETKSIKNSLDLMTSPCGQYGEEISVLGFS